MSFITAGITVIVTMLAFALLRHMSSATRAELAARYDLAELDRKYSRFQKVDKLLGLFVGLPTLGAITWAAAYGLNLYNHSRLLGAPDTVHLQTLPGVFWAIPGFAIGIGVSVVLSYLLTKAIFRDKASEYAAYKVLVLAYDPVKTLMYIMVPYLVFAATMTVLGFDCFVRATPRSLVINPFWSIGESTYPYARIKAIHSKTFDHADGGNVRQIPYYVVDFDDGSNWSTRSLFPEVNSAVLKEDSDLIEYVSKQSGIPIGK